MRYAVAEFESDSSCPTPILYQLTVVSIGKRRAICLQHIDKYHDRLCISLMSHAFRGMLLQSPNSPFKAKLYVSGEYKYCCDFGRSQWV